MSTRAPNSWLRLEQHVLGELDLEVTEADRACLDIIAADHRRLPPLALPERRERTRIGWLWPSVGLAVTTLLAVVVWRGLLPVDEPLSSLRTGVKGGDVVLVMVRERDGVIEEDATTFAPGDRFKVSMTCAYDEPVYCDVVVEQGGERSFPLEAIGPIPCASRVALPGAFTITGTQPAIVCLVVGPEPWSRQDAVAGDGPCHTLRPVD